VANVLELYLQGEAATGKIPLPPPLKVRDFHLFCSDFNAGAKDFAEELRDAPVFVTTGKQASAPLTHTTDGPATGLWRWRCCGTGGRECDASQEGMCEVRSTCERAACRFLHHQVRLHDAPPWRPRVHGEKRAP